MTIQEIKSKISLEREEIEELEKKKRKIDEKISIKQKKIKDYEKIIQTKEYVEIDNKLDELGLTREELLEALMNGDLKLKKDLEV